jgi:heme exporter protein B
MSIRVALPDTFTYISPAMSAFRRVSAVVAKDVRSEVRNRYAINALVMFVLTAVSAIMFALRSDTPSVETLSGMYWVVVFFSAMSGLSRIFVSEEERGTSLALRLSVSTDVLFAGKLIVNAGLTLLLTASVTILYLLAFPAFELQTPGLFALIVFLGSTGFAASATILAAIIAKANWMPGEMFRC